MPARDSGAKPDPAGLTRPSVGRYFTEDAGAGIAPIHHAGIYLVASSSGGRAIRPCARPLVRDVQPVPATA